MQITKEQLKSRLHYTPETGIFIWLSGKGGTVKGSVAGYTNTDGYVMIKVMRNLYRAHRLAWLYMTGIMPPELIDHSNRIKHDNRFCNLSLADKSKNAKNTKLPVNNTSGIIGVYWKKDKRKWHAQMKIDGIKNHLGYFDNIEDAAKARKKAEAKHGFHPQHGID